MKSKSSLYNQTIFRKDLTQTWPILLPYCIIWLLFPATIALEFYSIVGENVKPTDYYSSLTNAMQTNYLIAIAAVFGFVMAAWLFQYLNQSKSANMIHALPVTRRELFFTHTLAGVLMLLVPELVSFLCMTLVLVGYQVPVLTLVLKWYGMGAILLLLFFALAEFCVFLAGNVFASLFFYAMLNCLYELVWYAFGLVVSAFGYGLSDFATGSSQRLKILCPVVYLYRKLDFDCIYDDYGYVAGLRLEGLDYALPYLAAVVLLLVLSYLIYRKRKLELAGDFVAVPFVRPVMRWLVSILAGILCAVLCNTLMTYYGMNASSVSFMLWEVLFGFLAFLFMQMLIRKSFRVFEKRFFVEAGSCLVLGLLLFVGIRTSVTVIENYIPEADAVEYATVWLDYQMDYDGDELAKAIDIQQEIISRKNEIYDRNAVNAVNTSLEYRNVTVTYHLKNGQEIDRSYNVINNTVGSALIDRIVTEENDPDRYMKYLLNGSASSECCFDKLDFCGYSLEEDYYDYLDIDPSYNQMLFDAVRADVADGNLVKYNLLYTFDYSQEDREHSYMQTLDVNYTGHYTDADGNSYSGMEATTITFGSDCRHIIEALEECGAIDSEEDLVTRAQYDELYGIADTASQDAP